MCGEKEDREKERKKVRQRMSVSRKQKLFESEVKQMSRRSKTNI